MGRGENALKKLFLQKTLAIINSELELLNLKIQYPIPFQSRKSNFSPSQLYLTDETHLIEIMELVSGLLTDTKSQYSINKWIVYAITVRSNNIVTIADFICMLPQMSFLSVANVR